MNRLRHPMVAIFLVVFVDLLGFAVILPLLPFYAEKYGGSPFAYGLLVTVFAFCQFLSGPFLGQISDRVGRRPVLLVSQIGTCIGFIVLGMARSLPILFLARIIDGITAGNIVVAQAYISDASEPKNRAKAFGIIGIAFGLGFLIGPALSAFLSSYGYQYPAFASAALSFLSILGTIFLLSPARQEHHSSEAAKERLDFMHWRRYQKYFRDAKLRPLFFMFFCFTFTFSLFITGFALFCERRFITSSGHPYGAREVGYLFTYTGLLGIIIQGSALGRLVNKLGERKLVLVGFLSVVVGYGLMSVTHGLPVLLAVMAAGAFGTGVLRPAITSLISQSASRSEQGAILGINQSINSVAQITAPLVAGMLIDSGHLDRWALTAAGVAMLGYIVAVAQKEKSP